MRRSRSRAFTLLAAFLTAACSQWTPRLEGPRDAMSDPSVRHVRLTTVDNERLEVRVAEFRGDSIYGTLGSTGPLACDAAGPNCNAAVPIAEVGFVEVRSFSAVRTAAVIALPVTIVGFVFFSDDGCPAGVFGPGC